MSEPCLFPAPHVTARMLPHTAPHSAASPPTIPSSTAAGFSSPCAGSGSRHVHRLTRCLLARACPRVDRYCANLAGLVPADPWQAGLAEQAVGVITDVWTVSNEHATEGVAHNGSMLCCSVSAKG